jgi:archaellum component FlaC
MAKRPADLETEIDALYQLPLQEFTAARNALASRLKKQGRPEEADRVKAIQKPSMTAWTVNQLFWRERKDLDALMRVGDRFRAAQAAQLAGQASDMRSLLNERRDALSTLMKQAGVILQEAGHNASPETTRRIMTTLEALATYGDTPGAPRAGRLTDDIDPPGFEALAALVPLGQTGKKGSEPTRVLQFRQEERARRSREKKSAEDLDALRAKAREAIHAAEESLKEAQQEAERAEAALKSAAARAKAVQKEKEDIEARYEQIQAEAETATKEARRVAEEAENAAQAVEDAERELEKARGALEQLKP